MRDLVIDVADTVVGVDADFIEDRTVFREHIIIVGAHSVAEDDRVGDFHHGGLDVQRPEHALRLRGSDLFVEEGSQRRTVHASCIDDFVFLHGHAFMQHIRVVLRLELDSQVALAGAGCGLLAGIEVAIIHVRNAGFRIRAPHAHRMRMRLRVSLDRGRHTAIGIAFAQHRVDGAAEHLCVARLDLPFRIALRFIRVIGHIETL